MLIVSIMAMLACFGVSFLSKSALKWSCLMAAGMVLSIVASHFQLHSLIWSIDLAMMLTMIGMRQELNREWQDGVITLQGLVTTIYIVYSVFSDSYPAMISPAIDGGNILFIVQLSLVGFGGLMNSRRNYAYIRNQRKSGNKMPWVRTAWRMM